MRIRPRPNLGPFFLYRTFPSPREPQLVRLAARRREPAAAKPLRIVAMQTPLATPLDSELLALWRHFGTQGVAVTMGDSGLAVRAAAVSS